MCIDKDDDKNVDAPLDGDDDIISLMMDTGKQMDFREIAGIAHKGQFYALLQPLKQPEGVDENVALVFKVTRLPDGQERFEVERDDEIIGAVFAEYTRLMDNASKKSHD